MTIIERLRIGIAWQWRIGVFIAEVKSFGWLLADLAISLGWSFVYLAAIPTRPIRIIWSFTIGMIWQSLTCDVETITKLQSILKKK